MLHREGKMPITATALLGVALLALLAVSWQQYPVLRMALLVVLPVWLVLFGLIVNFFRNPARTIPADPNALLCPCDGKVVVIEQVDEPRFFKEKVWQVSIFMSPLNVHVNRAPAQGTVLVADYLPGKYLVAWHPKSSELNEQTFVATEGPSGRIAYKQIAGALARRIRWYIKPGDQLQQGQEFGFITFGSRMDILFPLSWTPAVQLEQKTTGGITLLAKKQP